MYTMRLLPVSVWRGHSWSVQLRAARGRREAASLCLVRERGHGRGRVLPEAAGAQLRNGGAGSTDTGAGEAEPRLRDRGRIGARQSSRRAAKSRIIRETFGLGSEYRRWWLQNDAPDQDVVLAPQLGDDVVFFPEVYDNFMEEREDLEKIMPYYYFDGVIGRSFAVKCRVIDMRYLYPDTGDFDTDRLVMAELTLAVLAVPKDAIGAPSRPRKRRRSQSHQPAHMYDLVESTFGQFVGVNANMARLPGDATPARGTASVSSATPTMSRITWCWTRSSR